MSAGYATASDLRFMVGHLREVECEHVEHGQPNVHHGGYAKWYIRMACFNCEWSSDVFPVCQPFIDFCRSGGMLTCKDCKAVLPGTWYLKLVTPIT